MANIKRIITSPAYLFIGVVQFLIVLAVVESIAEGVNVPHAFERKGKLARFLYVSETARIPLLIAFAIIMSPVTVAYAIKDKIHAKHQVDKVSNPR